VWQAPRPGRFLALAWIIGKPGSILRLNWEDEFRAALDRSVFVTDPQAELSRVEWIRVQLHEIGRDARIRYRWSRLANVLVGASPAVLLAAIEWSDSAPAGTGADIDDALLVTLVYLLGAMAFAWFCDRRSRRSVRNVEEFDAPMVLRSTLIGVNKQARRLIAEVGRQSAGEQRQLQDILWRIAEAERARADYLASTEEFDTDEFAPYLRDVENAQAGLELWSSPVR
jgi:hypothetical protein